MLDVLHDAFHGGGWSEIENDPVLFELRVAGFAYPAPFVAEGALYVRWLITWEGELERQRLIDAEAGAGVPLPTPYQGPATHEADRTSSACPPPNQPEARSA